MVTAPRLADRTVAAYFPKTPQAIAELAARQITLEVPEAELAARRARWRRAPSAMAWGVFGKYADTVRSASLGAVTTPATSPGVTQPDAARVQPSR